MPFTRITFILSVAVFFAIGLCDAKDEPVKPAKNADVAQTGKEKKSDINLSKSYSQPNKKYKRKDPFAPSDVMLKGARKTAASPSGSGSGESAIILSGIIAKGKKILICIRVGILLYFMAPGDSITVGDVSYKFVEYENETVKIKDEDGKEYKIRL